MGGYIASSNETPVHQGASSDHFSANFWKRVTGIHKCSVFVLCVPLSAQPQAVAHGFHMLFLASFATPRATVLI